MPVRKSVEDEFVVAGSRSEWFARCQDALEAQGFTKVDASETLFEITANYRKATVWGQLEVTLRPEGS